MEIWTQRDYMHVARGFDKDCSYASHSKLPLQENIKPESL